MKLALFIVALTTTVPALALVAAWSARLRGWLLAGIIFSTALGPRAGFTFLAVQDYRGSDRGLGFTLTDLLAWALAMALIIRFPRKLCWAPYNSFWMLAVFVIGCVAAWNAPMPLWGVFALWKWLRAYVVFWCVVNALRVGVSRQYVWLGLVAIGTLATVLALEQRFVEGIPRVSALFESPNLLAPYLNMVLPVLLVWAMCDDRMGGVQSGVSIVVVFGMLFSVVATLSRMGMACALLTVPTALCIVNLRMRSRRTLATTAAIMAALLVGGLAAAPTIWLRVETAPSESWQARQEHNKAAAGMARQAPFGVGLNNYSYVLTRQVDRNDKGLELAGEKRDQGEQPGFCHHIYWLTAAETGYLGLAVFLVFISRFLWLAFRHAWGPSFESALLCGCFLGLCAQHLTGFFEWVLRSTPILYLYIILCGLCVALAESIGQAEKPDHPAVPP